jgi:hypothetical protein
MLWYDSYELAHSPMHKFHFVKPLHRTGDTVRATLVIRRSYTLGVGFLELLCGDNRGNAVAHIKVER